MLLNQTKIGKKVKKELNKLEKPWLISIIISQQRDLSFDRVPEKLIKYKLIIN
jgi:hypothetical protein